jgi:integrase/recombinase XerD
MWLDFQGDHPTSKITLTSKITPQDLRKYLTYMATEYIPRRLVGKNEINLTPKTISYIFITLCAFFHWASDELEIPNPMKSVPAPKFQERPIEPFSKEEIESMLKACDTCEEAKTEKRNKFTMRRPTAYRDRALILTLFDTGLRASELCALNIEDLDTRAGMINVKHGVTGGAKGGKRRLMYLGKVARKAVWRYLASREDGEDAGAPLFLSKFGRHFSRDALHQNIHSLGKKASVSHTYPHRLRHTFAISYLTAGGDLFTMQSQLGHSSLEIVKIYAKVANIDSERVHAKASPADNWRL